MPFHNSRLIASACLVGLLAVPGVALAQSQETQTEEPQVQEQTSPPAAQQDQTDQQTETDTGSQTGDQTGEQTDVDPGEETAATAPTEEELDSYAEATISIERIQQAAQKQMQEAVETEGLTIDEYNRIAQAAKSDPDVDQALQERIQKRLGG